MSYKYTEEDKRNLQKWESSGLLSGLKKKAEKVMMARVLENQSREILKAYKEGKPIGEELYLKHNEWFTQAVEDGFFGKLILKGNNGKQY